MKAVTDIRYYDSIAKSINYSKTADYKSELATDNEYFNDIGEAIVSKDSGEMPAKSEMADRIEALPVSKIVPNPALVLWDWEGTKLAAYSREDALALTELPAPETLFPYAGADHELLVFQSWNWSLANIKAWIQNHEDETLDVGAIYTTMDGQDHNFWNSPRLDTANTISMQKRGTASIGDSAFYYCYSLTQINIPDGVTFIDSSAFQGCYSLTQINIPDDVSSIGSYAFNNCYSLTHVRLPDSITTIDSSTFDDCYSLTQISIPDGVTSIGDSAFANCYSLTHIRLPDSITTINNSAFANCYALARVNIPENLRSINVDTFDGCAALCDVLNGSKATLAHVNAFDGLPENYRIYVPRANLSWFETETNWATLYTEGHIVTIEDYIDYLESIGFNVDKYKEV